MRPFLLFVTVLTGLSFAGGAVAASPTASLVIRHQVRGCHAWSLNGGAFKASQVVHLTRGGSLLVTNNDVMPHQIVKTAGPAIVVKKVKNGMGMGMDMSGVGMMSHMGATVKVTFPKAGVYSLMTKAGEDYMQGMKTVGEDNVLRVKVVVS